MSIGLRILLVTFLFLFPAWSWDGGNDLNLVCKKGGGGPGGNSRFLFRFAQSGLARTAAESLPVAFKVEDLYRRGVKRLADLGLEYSPPGGGVALKDLRLEIQSGDKIVFSTQGRANLCLLGAKVERYGLSPKALAAASKLFVKGNTVRIDGAQTGSAKPVEVAIVILARK